MMNRLLYVSLRSGAKSKLRNKARNTRLSDAIVVMEHADKHIVLVSIVAQLWRPHGVQMAV